MTQQPIPERIRSIIDGHVAQKKVLTRDLIFYRADLLPSLSQHCDRFSPTCAECSRLLGQIEVLANELPSYLDGQMEGRRKFEQAREEITLHLRRSHHMVPKGSIVGNYTVAGMGLGLILGLVATVWLNPNGWRQIVPLATLLPMAAGRTWGWLKEKKIKSQARYL